MGMFLRDELPSNLVLNEESLKRINMDIAEIANSYNSATKGDEPRDRHLDQFYIIRFDNRGFKLYNFDEVIRHFSDADRVERFIFYLESPEATKSNKIVGKSLEIRFDALNPANCYLGVTDDDCNWVDSTFTKLQERIGKYGNIYARIARKRVISFVIQIIGVAVGFLLSFFLADLISTRLAIQSSLWFAFILVFLLFSNSWTFVYPLVLKIRDFYYPNISFKKQKGGGFIKEIIGALIITIIISTIIGLFWYIIDNIGEFIK